MTGDSTPPNPAQRKQEIYSRLSKRMRRGLKQIYKEIGAASQNDDGSPARTDQLFHEASAQLSEVLRATQNAAERILDIVEQHMESQIEARDIIDAARRGAATPEQFDRLTDINRTLGDDLAGILTALSFQDLTGQRIKKVVEALDKIERVVVEMYVSSGLIIEESEKSPQKGFEQLELEAREAAHNIRKGRGSALKGPTTDATQGNIDELLAQLGVN